MISGSCCFSSFMSFIAASVSCVFVSSSFCSISTCRLSACSSLVEVCGSFICAIRSFCLNSSSSAFCSTSCFFISNWAFTSLIVSIVASVSCLFLSKLSLRSSTTFLSACSFSVEI
ncbi:hypothetical protein NL108_001951 [Boleophthalmus pectinirostris]|nr:hypothetical protein NL108_001951 [Boleophthalmus pectinirostris]